MDGREIRAGDTVALTGSEGGVHLVRVPPADNTVEIKGLGLVAGELFAGLRLGARLQLGRRRFTVHPPTPALVFEALRRGAQVIGVQDAARIAHGCGVGPGSTVVEGGLGTGALSCYLAYLVGAKGRLHGFELRADHLKVARRNLEAAGLLDRVELREGDLADADVPCDAFVVDVPDPAAIVPAVERCLAPGGRAAFYTPLVPQVEAVHRALAQGPFERVETLEQLERRWVVHERGARPDFQMLGHTGFLTFATRVG